MIGELTVFRGTRGENILRAIDEGVIRPGEDYKIWFTKDRDDALQHGGDPKYHETYAIKALLTVVPGAAVDNKAVHGNPLAVVVTSTVPLPIKILELYIRHVHGDRLETVSGSVAIRSRLIRARAAAKV